MFGAINYYSLLEGFKSVYGLTCYCIFLIIIFCVGILQSIREIYFLWYTDSDIASIPVVLGDISQYGFAYLRNFRFPLDNWLFTVFLPDALWTRFFGDGPVAIMMTGITVFFFTALLVGGVVTYVVGIKRGVWAGVLTLCAPRAALGLGGYLIYPIAHNISVAWGLVAVLCMLVWLKRKAFIALLGAAIFLALATFSDPWMLPAFDLPLICASVLVWFWQGKGRAPRALHVMPWIGVTGGVLCAVILCKTHFLGFVSIGSDNTASFTKLRVPPQALLSIFGALSYYFNIVPGVTFQSFDWYIKSHNLLMVVGLVMVMLINGSLLSAAMYMLVRRCVVFFRKHDAVRAFLFGFLVFSILGMVSSAFVLGSVKHISSSRYLVNIYYCVILLFFIGPWECFSVRFRRFCMALGAMWVIAGMVSNMGAWSFSKPLVRTLDTGIVPVLKAEHVDTAYGSYWGAEAHAMTWLSHGEVPVRPLLYEPDYHGFLPSIWSSPSWYRLPPQGKWALILTSTDGNDVCPPFPTCGDAAVHQFGPPLAVKQARRAKIMIYDNARFRMDGKLSVNSWKTALPLPDESTFLGWKSFYPNSGMNRNDLVTLQGWAEPAHGMVATNAPLARVGVPVPASARRMVTLRFLLASTRARFRDVDVRYKGRNVAEWRVGLTTVPLTLELPVEAGEQFVSCDLLVRNPGKGRHGTAEGVTLSEVQVVE